MYRADQWKVLGILGAHLPKRPSMKTKDIATKFSRREDPDRVVRNAYRKLRAEGHIEIAERGEYRITQKGSAFYTKSMKDGFKPLAPRKKGEEKPARKPTRKATSKKSVPKKSVPKKTTTKKAASKKAAPKKASGNGAVKKAAKQAVVVPPDGKPDPARSALSL